MFEDSTFESGGRIKSKSGRWMIFTGIINGSILVLLILIPLIYPEALPQGCHADGADRAAAAAAATAPATAAGSARGSRAVGDDEQSADGAHADSEKHHDGEPKKKRRRRVLAWPAWKAWVEAQAAFSAACSVRTSPKVQAAAPKKVNISAGVAVGMLIQKTTPIYPPIAKAARVSGTVVLQATISKTGTITNLRVVSGPAMLQQAALDAVKTWRYRPYLLNNEPVEVETTINVIFSLGG